MEKMENMNNVQREGVAGNCQIFMDLLMSSKVALISVLFEQVTKRWITTQLGLKRSGWQWKVCL